MSIVLEQLTKRYEGHPVVNNVSLEIGDGEFFVLLGSSGSGKTTILSLIAGLAQADQGRISLHGRDVTALPPQQRRVGFVFQNYALFQSMSVADNVEFGLSIRKTAPAERRRRREELLEMVGLAGLGDRRPAQLSGGQQQRVALARALAHQPDVLLLDEPLGALDAKIRIDLRRNLKMIQRQLGVTTIFVTHDQEEAFDLADRVGVMSFGRLVEVGTPEQLYQRPQTEFVATFLGTANLLVGNMTPEGVRVGSWRFPLAEEDPHALPERRVQVMFRPEDVDLAAEPDMLTSPSLGEATVEEISFGGAYERLRLRLPPITGVRPISPPVTFGSNSILVDATRSPEQTARFPLKLRDHAWIGVHRIHTLAHPGLSFLIVTDGSERAQAALDLGSQIARLAHARVILVGCGPRNEAFQTHLQEARKQMGSGLAALETLSFTDPPALAVPRAIERYPQDLAILGFSGEDDFPIVEQLLESGDHHLLLVQSPQPVPDRALICVSSGEPGKDDVLFAGRLVRHLSAQATLMTVLPAYATNMAGLHTRAESFLQAGVQSLSLLGVPAQTSLRFGTPAHEITTAMREGDFNLLVLGTPLANPAGKVNLTGTIAHILGQVKDRPILIVRSHFVGGEFNV